MYIFGCLFSKRFFSTLSLMLFTLMLNAQLATYPMKTGGGNPAGGQPLPAGTNANITAGSTSVGIEITNFTNGTYNNSGLRVRPNNLAWPNSISNSFCVNIPLAPKPNYDFNLTSVTFKNNSLDNTPNLWCQLSYSVNGSSVFNLIGTPQAVTVANLGTTITIGGLNEGFYNGANYVFRFYFYGNGANDKGQGFRMTDLVFNGTMITPPSIAPTVVTGVLGSATKYSNTVAASSYTISNGGANVKIVAKSGVCYGTIATPTIANSTTLDVATNGVATATFNSTLNGLTPATTYYTRAYAITQVDTVYGAIVSFTTMQQTAPTLNTNSPTVVLSNKATIGGNSIDSGGYAVVEKGVLYSTQNTNLVFPATGQTKATADGIGNANYTTTIKNLLPNTKYYIKAFARNIIGAGYGNLDSFTTTAPVPTITVTPSVLDFGDITYNAPTPVLSYKINASYLSPAAGSITVAPNTGYSICATYNGTYQSTPLSISYIGSTLANKIIYVKTKTNTYGVLAGTMLHSGGGAVAPNIDTTFLTTNIVQNPDTLSNAGSDFWCGFGYQEAMEDATTQFDTTLAAKGAHLSLFIAAGNQGDSVIVELPGIPNAPTFPRKVFVPASGFVEIGGFPVGDGVAKNPSGGPDSRLYYTGVSQRGIHIYTKTGVPVSAWLYVWTTGDAAAGAMLFPSNTWNSSYVVQSVGGKANNSNYNNNSFFYVIAKDDNTVITFKPTNNIIDSTAATIFNNGPTTDVVKYKKDSTYTIVLNRGEVFNAMGYVGDPAPGSSDPGALDLSGTKVSTTCDKRIAVFGGNGRCVLGTAGSNPTVGNSTCNNPASGSDNLIQQMFPKVAWGTTYLTVPTKNMANNLFRVYVQDVNTDVKVNNVLLPKVNLIKGLYYQFDVNRPSKVESNIPVSVTQFIVSGACNNPASGNIGKGDPEMITLSPIQQSIKSTTVYSSIFKNGNAVPSNGCSYINVVVKGFDGVSSFRLDGLTSGIDTGGNTFTGAIYAASVPANLSNVNAFRKHPFDTSYYYATFRVTSKTKHTLFSTQGFNAIAYGVSDGESYGYNAGTTINNLSAIKFSLNPYGADTATGSVKTCKGNLVTLQIALPYDTTTINSIIWDPGNDASIYSPTGQQAGTVNPNTSKPVCIGTIVRDGRFFYIYKSPVQYTFFEEGAYKVKVTVNGTFVSDCGGTDIQYMNVVVGHDDISFTATQAGCGSKDVTIVDATTPLTGTSILKWAWNFGDNSPIDTARVGVGNAPNPSVNPHTYPANNAYYIKLTTINSVGCFSYDSVLVDLAFSINSSFTTSKDTVCVGENVLLTPTSSTNAAKWFWDFGDGSNIDSSNTAPNIVSHPYTAAGTYIISHFVKTSVGCPSLVVKDTVIVSKTPVASFVTPSGVCLPGNTQFINSSDTSVVGAAVPYTYLWSFGTGNLSDTSNVKNPIFGYTIAPPNAVTLVATSRFGCKSTIYSQVVNNVFVKPTSLISNTSSNKVCVGSNASFFDASSGTNQTVNSWYWSFGDGVTASTQNPQHIYSANGTDTVKLVIGTDKGCVSDTATLIIKVNPKPKAGTILPSSCITSGSLLFQDNSTVPADANIQTPYTYTWNFGDNANIYTTKDSTHTYAGIGTYYINHSITTLNGCTDTKIDTFIISGSKPVPLHKIPNPNLVNAIQYCSNQTVTVRDSSTIALGTIKKVEIFWDIFNVYGVGLNTNPTVDNTPQNGVLPITTKVYSFKYPYSATSKNIKIRIVNYNDNNCYSEDTIPITVYGTPIVKFDTIRGICVNGAPKKINFAYDSVGIFDALNYIRLAKKPTYSGIGVYNDSMFNPTIADTGIHYIKCVYETNLPFNNHCKDSAYAPIRVWALPVVKFDTALIKCEGNSITFIDQSIAGIGAGNIKSWLWKFGEPSSGANDSSTINPTSHLYTSYGTYNVTLKVTSDSGCSNTSTPKPITINPKPKVGFISPAGTCAGTPVGFTDTSKITDGTQGLFTHFWNFGDPASLTLNTAIGTPLPNPSHLYANTPPNPVKLIVTSNNGCIDSASVTLGSTIFPKQHATYIANGKPKDNPDITRVCLGNPIKFESGLAANNTFWIFGDSGNLVRNGVPQLHIYPTSGVFTGQFYADDINGCRTDTVTVRTEIWALPTVNFDTALIKCEGNSVLFTDKSVAGLGAGNINARLWKFGDPISGTNDSSIIQNPSHLYTNFGTYDVTLKITSDSGCVNISTPKTITINPKPKVGFISPAGTCAGTPVGFTDTSKIADGTQSLFTHNWNFGDPASLGLNTATGTPLPTPSHLYSNTPPNPVKLIVTSNNGCVDSASITLSSTIFPKQHATYFANGKLKDNADITRVCLGNTIKFASGLPANNTYWVFGDSGVLVSNIASPLHTYPTSGSFTGKFYADDINGCRTDTVAMKVEIWALPTPIIQVNNPTCEKQLISFIDKSVASSGTGNINTWLWKFGEPSSGFLDSSALQNPVHKYNTYGNYNVILTVISDSGCKATIPLPTVVNVHPKPIVKFVLPISVCLPLAAQFTDTSKIADGTESQFTHSWTFGDVGSGTNNFAIGKPLGTVSHFFSTSANYKILLIITSKDGCIDSSSQTLFATAIHNQPKADYNVNTTNKDTPTVCLGTPITFKDASIGTVKSYWIWGDEGLTTYLGNTPPPHLFTPAGSYYGIHFIDDIFGCRSDTADFITIVDSFPVTVGGEKYILQGSFAYLTPYISGATTVLWTPIVPAGLTNDYLDYNDVENPICTPLDSVIYRIDATTDAGCAAPPVYYSVKLFSEPNIPNVFSPNGDGINDTWEITSLQYFTGSTVQVFTRSGQLVFTSLGYSKPWKGVDLSGNPLPVGAYYFIIKPGLGLQPRSGSITILR